VSGAWRIWRAPIGVGLASTLGLLGGLLLEGDIAKVAACFALAAPVAVVGLMIAAAGRRD
jgi:hypothetical protein